jgi:para-aminobenzoate synthetase component 1
MMRWASQFNIFCFLDNQDYSIQPHRVDCLLAAGAKHTLIANDLSQLDAFLAQHPGWCFGHFSYDLKNAIHHFTTNKNDRIGFPGLCFFVPEVLLQLDGQELTITADDPETVWAAITVIQDHHINMHVPEPKARLSREAYVDIIRQLQKHIVRGDCYEINFCQEFFAEQAVIDPVEVFERLVEISPNPFSALYRLDEKYLICASPERFLTRLGNRIYSQPMKGTIRRDVHDAEEDRKLKDELMASAKDRSENVMVVDMVRNDLTKVCMPASVQVDELFGVYSYPQVHQMISTVSGTLLPGIGLAEIIQASFPMGSMTGAPKHRVMELIDAYEVSARGIFSGSVGYINPQGDFDFNVVIRSIMYHSASRYLSYQLGSGITFYSDPMKEWEECMLKGTAIKKVLTG